MHAAIGCRHTLFDFLRPLCKAAPILEKLVLHAGTVRYGRSSTWDLDDLFNTGEVLNYLYPTHPPFEGHTPLLHTLVLSHLYFSHTSGIYRNLINLTIIHLHPTEALEPFFRVLSSSPALEKLNLVMRSPEYEVRFLQPPQLPHVHLPRLRFLGITCDVIPFIAAILAHLSFPMHSRIHLSSRMDRDWRRWSALSAVLRDPSMRARLPSFQLSVSVMVMDDCVVSVLSALDLSRIETFGVFEIVAASSYCFWQPVLRRMHRLRCLSLHRVSSATLVAVLRTLQWYTHPIGNPGAPYCTQLQCLGLGEVEKDVAAELVDFLKFCVANRKVLAQVRVTELRGWDADMVNQLNGHGNIRVVYMPPTG
ncbi:hypothetical protein A0H81_09471 [Grifola frondosa]|uniref:F-box domain-containing protein n=1 Tax=Grifola frondosa TaxID=5627 RepID=A0A1C7M1P6_GRIFR|nr:hypothetical protein A0H81_09471 [Grifola frondosa]